MDGSKPPVTRLSADPLNALGKPMNIFKMFRDLWHIARRDLLELSRDRLRLITFFIMPVFMMIMTGYIFPNQGSLKDIPIGIANQDGGEMSQTLVQTISDLQTDDHTAFQVKDFSDVEAIKDGIKKQEIAGGLFIPDNFTAKIDAQEEAAVTIIEDQSNPQIASMVNQILAQIVNGFGQQIGTQEVSQLIVINHVKPAETAPSAAQVMLKPIQATIEGLVPGNPSYFEFMAPGIMAMVVMTAVLTGLAASISGEKAQGTLDGILIAPISRVSIILGKAFSQSIRGLIQGAIVLLLAFFLFGVTVQGNLLLVLLLLLLGIFSFVGLGILISAIATQQETATQILFMLQMPMLFLSGVFFPILLMPQIMQKIAYCLPLTYAIGALRKVMVLGSGVGAIQMEIWALLLIGIITTAIAVPVFKRVITK